MSQKTIFQKIVDREIPAHIVYEDADFLAFLDIHPKSQGHTLLIPKTPATWVYDLSPEDFVRLWGIAQKLALHLKTTLGAEYVSFQTFGVDVPHAHIHIVPFYSLTEKYTRTETTQEELKELADKVRM